MTAARIILLVYGALLLAGGVVGYVKGRSSKSLIGGLLGAFLSGLSYGLLGSFPRWGLGLGVGTALTLPPPEGGGFLRSPQKNP